MLKIELEISTSLVFWVVIGSDLLAVLKVFFVRIERFEMLPFEDVELCPQRIFLFDNFVLQHFDQFLDVLVSQIVKQRDLEKDGKVEGQADQKNEHDQQQKPSWNVNVRSDAKKLFLGVDVFVDRILDDEVNDDSASASKDAEDVEEDSPVDDQSFRFIGENSERTHYFLWRHVVVLQSLQVGFENYSVSRKLTRLQVKISFGFKKIKMDFFK